ncbi:hypothetical protein [Paenibacillus glycanilyticus]|uniref:Uncharacterized protein n=1 Tax=Paenibacillus glycanilyticus TaxID=126569 RepID=A0ABQ6GC78_9BACL|nr:hypothetical protein [Paenibacillus glycanilyticus]GLX66873.1 hypothetical protein MU1_12170 [Paenibacillus glycanilyticus]
MERSDWIPLRNINDDKKIWAGTKVRLYNVGLNVIDKADDYYDYLVSFIYDNVEYLQLTNLSQGEAGNIICVIKKDTPNHYALGKTLKEMMGLEYTFVLFGS